MLNLQESVTDWRKHSWTEEVLQVPSVGMVGSGFIFISTMKINLIIIQLHMKTCTKSI